MPISRQHVLGTFAAGALAALPLIATVVVMVWLGQLLLRWFGPGSAVGDALSHLGLGLVDSVWLAYLLGVMVALAGVYLLGLLVNTGLAKAWQTAVQAALRRIPLVGHIYDAALSLADLLARKDQGELKSMQPVWLHFSGPGGVAVLGLLPSGQTVQVGGVDCLAVLVPTAPLPVGGGLLYVPIEWVSPADIGIEALTSIYVSMGATSARHLPAGRAGMDVKRAS
jgi:uncharacterized membrane protein